MVAKKGKLLLKFFFVSLLLRFHAVIRRLSVGFNRAFYVSWRQSATVCGNLEQSELFVIYRIMPFWLHNWNLGRPVAQDASRLSSNILNMSSLHIFCRRQSGVVANSFQTAEPTRHDGLYSRVASGRAV